MTYRKVGGLHFLTIGPIGLVWYLNREPRKRMQNRMAAMRFWWLTTGDRWSRMLVP